uniref:Uncharacterized protein n=1 Tax=Arundo donax TaxID=35708 RepID=A0A0A9FM34_ARUDO
MSEEPAPLSTPLSTRQKAKESAASRPHPTCSNPVLNPKATTVTTADQEPPPCHARDAGQFGAVRVIQARP